MRASLIQALQLGHVPRVVGTIITADYLRSWCENPQKLPCDLVELRVDGFPDFPDWISIGKQIEQQGPPVFATIRLENEGGRWNRGDTERWSLLEPAIRELSGVDVEVRSQLAGRVSELCGSLRKLAIFSFHDFHSTPPRAELEQILQSAKNLNGIGKIAATANRREDVELLRSLLQRDWGTPVCIIGMGPFGRGTRLEFPLEGSCLTYGYLDTPGAPGQYSAAELTRQFQNVTSKA